MRNMMIVAGMTAAAGMAWAGPVATYTLSDLDASFTRMANTVNIASASETAGDFTRPDQVETATFNAGFADSTSASYAMSINVSNKAGGFADGAGTFTFTDVDGDFFTGSIDGTWSQGGFGAIFFTGALSNVTFDSAAGNGTFDGTSGDSASIPFGGPFDGSIVQLTFNLGGTFFDTDFASSNTLVSAQLIPTPGAMGLLGLGGIVATRRRRA